jgi:hypothetical protein
MNKPVSLGRVAPFFYRYAQDLNGPLKGCRPDRRQTENPRDAAAARAG